MYFNNANFLVAGLQKSGFSASKYLIENNANVYIYDKRKTPDILENVDKLTSFGAIYIEDYENLDFDIDVLVVSPGVPIDSEICKYFKLKGVRIIGEIELACLDINKPIVAITGTNGKTTVSTLIDNALNFSGIKSILCGNVGTPVSSQIESIKNSDVCVLEVSSYQLETTYLFCPHIAVILNVTPDHLERHYSFENYVLVKSKIVLPLRESEYAVLNYDDENVKKLSRLTKAKIVWFSLKEKVNGAYLYNDAIYFKDEKIIEVNEITLREEHNVSNVLATIAVLKSLKIKNEDIVKAITSFKGVKHRLQKVKTKNQITFINDSKSTNPDSTIKAVQSSKNPTNLIIGGSDKGLDYTEMFNVIKNSTNIKHVIITGSVSNVMQGYAVKENLDNYIVVKSFEKAVKLAYTLADNNYQVLLSPGTSSFDEFRSFEERGDKFVEIVESL